RGHIAEQLSGHFADLLQTSGQKTAYLCGKVLQNQPISCNGNFSCPPLAEGFHVFTVIVEV
ncbi:MAG: hypothetical protein COT91_04260, partial [Candidatus Doudnabacteria bacterium CG10_big_fil_rev_8_21_14_0_10_41_10]